MAISNHEMTNDQREACAIVTMRDTIGSLAQREKISYEDAMIKFTNSRVYDALFDYDTGIWREGSDHLLYLYDRCVDK